MGDLRSEANTSLVPAFDQLHTDECFISWQLWLTADVSHDDILEVFDWVIDECELNVEQVGAIIEQPQESSPVTATVIETATIEDKQPAAPPTVEGTAAAASPFRQQP